MKHQQTNTRRGVARSTATASRFPSLDTAVRKGAIRSRSRIHYPTEMDEIEFARSSLASGTRSISAIVGRDGFDDIRSIANIQKLSMLQEVFPDVAVEIMEDVLIAAQFQMDVAASMLSELLKNEGDSPERADMVLVDWAAVQNDGESDDWHDVSESRPEMQQWVLVQDDWEVVDSEVANNQVTTRSFADVLRTSGSGERAVSLPQLQRVSVSASLSPLTPLKNKNKTGRQTDDDVAEELSIKTFNARKRRALRKFRG